MHCITTGGNLTEPAYPFHDRTITVTQCGRICMAPHKVTLSTVFAGQNVGVKQVGDKIWLVTFMDYDLGFVRRLPCSWTFSANDAAMRLPSWLRPIAEQPDAPAAKYPLHSPSVKGDHRASDFLSNRLFRSRDHDADPDNVLNRTVGAHFRDRIVRWLQFAARPSPA